MQIKHKITGAVLWERDILSLSGADLGGAYLSGADLSGADLGGAYLSGADLGGADLGGANLRGAYLGGAYLGGADLSGAYLSGANLSGAYLSGAYLSGADLGGADLGGANLRGANLSGANLHREIGKVKRFVASVSRSDGYIFLGFERAAGGLGILAGCQNKTLASYRTHVKEYTSAGKRRETTQILDFLAKRFKAKSWN